MAARRKKTTGRKAGRKAGRKKATTSALPKRGRGRPAYKPTRTIRRCVEGLALCGTYTQEEIADIVEIDAKTLRLHFRVELTRAEAKRLGEVCLSLFERAVDKKHRHGAACAMFIAKTKLGWKEASKIEHDLSEQAAEKLSARIDQYVGPAMAAIIAEEGRAEAGRVQNNDSSEPGDPACAPSEAGGVPTSS